MSHPPGDPAAAALVLALLAIGSCAASRDQRLAACGAEEAGNEVVRSVELDRASDDRRLFPDLGAYAELNVDAPVVLVFYEGPTVIIEEHRGARAKIIRQSPICAWFGPDRVVFLTR